MHINWAEIPAVYLVSHQRFSARLDERLVLLLLRVCTACVCVCVRVCIGWVWVGQSYYSRNGLQRFGGYLFLLVNCEADSIESLGQFKWAFSQITSVIAYIQVSGRPCRDRAWEAPEFSGEGQIWPQLWKAYTVIEIIVFFLVFFFSSTALLDCWQDFTPKIPFVVNLSCLFLINGGS